MKKIFYGLLLISTSAYGQVASQPVVLPTVATPPAIVTTSPNETTANMVATTNQVYIDQQGNNVNVNIVQTGVSNIIGTDGDKIYLRGDNQTIIYTQTGDSNSIYTGLISDVGGLGVAAVTVQQIGDQNQVIIRCGVGVGDATCNQFDLNARFTGNNNVFQFTGAGANIRNSTDVTGNNNEFYLAVDAPNSTQTLLYTGDYNITNITQTGIAGINGHSLFVDLMGTGNTITTEQYGATETTINLQVIGNNGVYNIKTGH